jgi:hypothetical protein
MTERKSGLKSGSRPETEKNSGRKNFSTGKKNFSREKLLHLIVVVYILGDMNRARPFL